MSSSEIFTSTVKGKDLWHSLSLDEGKRNSPTFRLALQTGESEVELLQDKFKAASVAFQRTSKLGEQFSDSLTTLNDHILSLSKPSPALPVEHEGAADLVQLLKTLSCFATFVKELSTSLVKLDCFVTKASSMLEKLIQQRKAFSRSTEQWESAILKSAGVARRSLSDAEDADRTLKDYQNAYEATAGSYLSALRRTLGPTRLSTVFRSTLTIFELERTFVNSLIDLFNNTEKEVTAISIKRLKVALNIYESEKQSIICLPVSNGSSTKPIVHHEGYLLKRCKNKRWKLWVRRWFVVTNNSLLYCSSINAETLCLVWKVVEPDLHLCTAKIIRSATEGSKDVNESYQSSAVTYASAERRFTFELISPSGKIHHLQAENVESLNGWVTVLRSGLLINSEHCEKANFLDVPSSAKLREMSKSSDNLLSVSSAEQYNSIRSNAGSRLLDELPGNQLCSDCLSSDVSWASTNLGVTLCTDCASSHRSIGVHLSKVRSLVLDNWEPELLEVMQNLGNNIVARIYEANLQSLQDSSPSSYHRPEPGTLSEANQQVRKAWIDSKWIERKFVNSCLFSSREDANLWLSNIVYTWTTQSKRRRKNSGISPILPPKMPSSPNHKSPLAITQSRSPLRQGAGSTKPRNLALIDRRRGSASLRGVCSSRTLLTLESLLSHLEILRTAANNRRNSNTTTPQLSVVEGRAPAISFRPSIENIAARLVLIAGARLGCAPLILAALANGASPNANSRMNSWGTYYRLPVDSDPLGAQTPPLISAVNSGRIAACELLLANGANIDSVDQDGSTALHHACRLQRVHLVCLLLRRRAVQTIKDKSNRTPLDVAVDSAHADIVTLLRLQSLQEEAKNSDAPGTDETAAEVFRDFTSRVYHLEWDSDEQDYYDPKQKAEL